MKLELKHLTPYLPYGLSIGQYREDLKITFFSKMVELSDDRIRVTLSRFPFSEIISYYEAKPILRPLSDLSNDDWKEEVLIHYADLEVHVSVYDSGNDNKNDFGLTVTYKLMDDVFTDLLICRGLIRETPYHFYEWLIKNHFDVFGLIQSGLAIDINTLSKEG